MSRVLPCPKCGSNRVARTASPTDTICMDCQWREPHEWWDRRPPRETMMITACEELFGLVLKASKDYAMPAVLLDRAHSIMWQIGLRERPAFGALPVAKPINTLRRTTQCPKCHHVGARFTQAGAERRYTCMRCYHEWQKTETA